MATIKLLNNTDNSVFVLSVNGGAIWELEPGIWRKVELTDREWEAYTPYFKAEKGLRHSDKSGKHEVGYLEDKPTNFAEDKDYDKPENFKKYSGQELEEVWVLTSAAIKAEGELKVGKTAQLVVDQPKGKKDGKGSEAAYTQGVRLLSATITGGTGEATINQKNFTIKFTKAGDVKVKAEVSATGNDSGKVTTEELSLTVTA